MNTFTFPQFGMDDPDAMIEEDEYEDIFFLPNPIRIGQSQRLQVECFGIALGGNF